MEIFIRCTISEEKLGKAYEELGFTEEDLTQRLEENFKEDIFSTLEDSQDIFSEVAWSINEPLF